MTSAESSFAFILNPVSSGGKSLNFWKSFEKNLKNEKNWGAILKQNQTKSLRKLMDNADNVLEHLMYIVTLISVMQNWLKKDKFIFQKMSINFIAKQKLKNHIFNQT
mgnify:CR=1 FL=1